MPVAHGPGGVLRCELELGNLTKLGQKILARAPAQPPCEVCEREDELGEQQRQETTGRGWRTTLKATPIKVPNKDEQANYRKQMKSRVRHLI